MKLTLPVFPIILESFINRPTLDFETKSVELLSVV